MKQIFNPFLPLNKYIPDGEPHVFNDHIYLFGSHDQENGETFCMLDYEFYSAPINDLSNWSSKGINYSAKQDPLYSENNCYMFAPDVVKGNDGKYYLYYCMAGYKGRGGYSQPISVAVSDTPDGKYEYLGVVKNKDDTPFMKYVNFDPAVINDDGVIRLYSGCWYPFDELRNILTTGAFTITESKVFGKTMKHIRGLLKNKDSIFGPFHMELEDDMLTLKTEPVRVLPLKHKGTKFAKHGFFEGSSIRKFNGLYYFIYSSLNNHELCYATSKYPDRDFTYGGVIVSNGDIGYLGRKKKDRVNATGTNHGSVELINGEFYVFYHRLTHNSDYSRQACAEKITIEKDGSIKQVEITSCGLMDGYLSNNTVYPASICCNLTNGHMPHGSNKKRKNRYPCVYSENGYQYVKGISNKTLIGYKYFNIQNNNKITLTYRGKGKGILYIYIDNIKVGSINIFGSEKWMKIDKKIIVDNNKKAFLHFEYEGKGKIDILNFELGMFE